jgi:hypothetical protein
MSQALGAVVDQGSVEAVPVSCRKWSPDCRERKTGQVVPLARRPNPTLVADMRLIIEKSAHPPDKRSGEFAGSEVPGTVNKWRCAP